VIGGISRAERHAVKALDIDAESTRPIHDKRPLFRPQPDKPEYRGIQHYVCQRCGRHAAVRQWIWDSKHTVCQACGERERLTTATTKKRARFLGKVIRMLLRAGPGENGKLEPRMTPDPPGRTPMRG
jgi:DNA-directed RNA polymerase subunit RPC12/RpoP